MIFDFAEPFSEQLNLEGLALLSLEIAAQGLGVPLLAAALERDLELLHSGRGIQIVQVAAVAGDEVNVRLVVHRYGEGKALGEFADVDLQLAVFVWVGLAGIECS